jgi:hypothetical protein
MEVNLVVEQITVPHFSVGDHITLNFNNNISMAAVFLDIEKSFDKTWHSSPLYKLSELAFSMSVIKLIASFLTNRKFKDLVEGEFSMPGVPQGSVLAPILYTTYINNAPAAPGTYLALFADDTCIYVTPLQVSTQPYCSEVVVRAMEHKD